jgi:hypothetical protein
MAIHLKTNSDQTKFVGLNRREVPEKLTKEAPTGQMMQLMLVKVNKHVLLYAMPILTVLITCGGIPMDAVFKQVAR